MVSELHAAFKMGLSVLHSAFKMGLSKLHNMQSLNRLDYNIIDKYENGKHLYRFKYRYVKKIEITVLPKTKY